MKKWAVLMLALLLAVNAGVIRASAAKDSVKYTVDEAALIAPEFEKKPLSNDRSPASARLTDDTVTIDARVFRVVTGSGTELLLTAPSGTYCVTQDVYQQLEIYMSLYGDVGAALKNYISRGIHMDIYDYCAGVSTYVAESDNTLAAMAGDMNTLKDTSVRQIADYLSKNWYGGCPAMVKTVGENKYAAFDLSKDYGFVVYHHFANGKLIQVYTFCDSGVKGIKRVEAVLAGLTFSAAEPAAEAEVSPAESEETIPPEETTTPPEEETTPASEETAPSAAATAPTTGETTAETTVSAD